MPYFLLAGIAQVLHSADVVVVRSGNEQGVTMMKRSKGMKHRHIDQTNCDLQLS
jgi:hypothetical protein